MSSSGVSIEEVRRVAAEADLLYSRAAVDAAFERMAGDITMRLQDRTPVVLCVMIGAVVAAGQLLSRLDFPLEIDYVHATRYRGETSGSELHWLATPATSLQGRDVLIIDDILDEGYTLRAIVDYCREQGAREVLTAVLVDKLHDRKQLEQADFTGLEVEDRYVFGYGMDYKGYLRNAPGIYAVRG